MKILYTRSDRAVIEMLLRKNTNTNDSTSPLIYEPIVKETF